jgi:hypothetical protein
MTGTAVVRSGTDIIHAATGEVIGEAPTFEMVQYIASVTTPKALEQQHRLAAAYDAACASLIGPNDIQVEGNRSFKKKSAFAKLGRHFNISTIVVSTQKEMLGEKFCATVTVKALAPWGQSAEAVGACATDEESGRRSITIADAIATAETRAHNRAISRLIAMGEVSAEEIEKGERSGARGAVAVGGNSPGGRAAAVPSIRDPLQAAGIQPSPVSPGKEAAPEPTGGQARSSGKPAPIDKLMPFGKQKGLPLGEIASGDLQSTVKWCREKDAGKFKDLISACESVIASREFSRPPASTTADADFEDFPPALQDETDDLPF